MLHATSHATTHPRSTLFGIRHHHGEPAASRRRQPRSGAPPAHLDDMSNHTIAAPHHHLGRASRQRQRGSPPGRGRRPADPGSPHRRSRGRGRRHPRLGRFTSDRNEGRAARSVGLSVLGAPAASTQRDEHPGSRGGSEAFACPTGLPGATGAPPQAVWRGLVALPGREGAARHNVSAWPRPRQRARPRPVRGSPPMLRWRARSGSACLTHPEISRQSLHVRPPWPAGGAVSPVPPPVESSGPMNLDVPRRAPHCAGTCGRDVAGGSDRIA